MTSRFLLYIDILGFSSLATRCPEQIDELYKIVASLNVHKHRAFKAIVFSDTVLIYNVDGGETVEDRNYLVMYLCEFAQDLQHRLTGNNIFFRAVLVHGEFRHYELNGIPCFFGQALIEAYRAEKRIKAIGLFMRNDLVAESDIFHVVPYDGDFSFVCITQALETAEHSYGGEYPLPLSLMEQTELIYHLVPEILYIRAISSGASHPDMSISEKYEKTLRLLAHRYPRTVQFLKSVDFDMTRLCPDSLMWGRLIANYPQAYDWAIESRVNF